MSRNVSPRHLCHDGHPLAQRLAFHDVVEEPVEASFSQLADDVHALARRIRAAKAAKARREEARHGR